jgi:hypothetical protein
MGLAVALLEKADKDVVRGLIDELARSELDIVDAPGCTVGDVQRRKAREMMMMHLLNVDRCTEERVLPRRTKGRPRYGRCAALCREFGTGLEAVARGRLVQNRSRRHDGSAGARSSPGDDSQDGRHRTRGWANALARRDHTRQWPDVCGAHGSIENVFRQVLRALERQDALET